MQIVEKGSPCRIVVEDGVSKADDVAACVGTNGGLIQPRRSEASRPHLSSIRDNVAVEVRISVCTSIVAPPAVGMQSRNAIGVVLCCLSIVHTWNGLMLCARSAGHDGLLIGPGIGTVPKPAAGPS